MRRTLITILHLLSFWNAYSQVNNGYLIAAGRLFDSEKGVFISNMSILVVNDTISWIKPTAQVTLSEHQKFTPIDLTDKSVLPGLIDAHSHLLFQEKIIPNYTDTKLDMTRMLLMDGDAYRAILGTVKAKAYLLAGITSVQDLGNSGKFADFALKRAINEGLILGPRMRCAGQGLSAEGGQLNGLLYDHRNLSDEEYRIVNGPVDAVAAVREHINMGADVIKIYANNSPNKTMLNLEELSAIVNEAHRYNIRVTAHATSALAIKNAVTAGVDAIEHGYSAEYATLKIMAKKGIILVPTDGDSISFRQYAKLAYPNDNIAASQIIKSRQSRIRRLKQARLAGVTIAFGSDDFVDINAGLTLPAIRVLDGYSESGMTVCEILQTATINSAKQLNWSSKAGVIKKGYWADIIATDLNLEKDIKTLYKISFVMKGGQLIVNSLKDK